MSASPGRPTARRVLAELRPHRRIALATAAATCVEVALATAGPLILALAIGAIVDDRGSDVLLWGGLLCLVVVGDNVARYVRLRCSTRLAQDYLGDLRGHLLDQLFALDLEFFDRERAGRIVARLTSDVDHLQQFLEQGVAMLLRAVLLLAATVGVLLFLSVPLTGILLACVLPLVPVSIWFRRRAFPAQLRVRESNADLLTHLDETLTAMPVVQAFGLESRRAGEFRQLTQRMAGDRMSAARLNVVYQSGLDALPLVAMAAVLLSGSALIASGAATLTAVVAAVLYVGRLFEPVQQLAELSTIFQSAAAALAKIFQFRAERPTVDDVVGADVLHPGPGRIELRQVSFRYTPNGPDVLRGIDLTLDAGERIALVGGSGAGKSTLAKLLARFYDPTDGQILLDGQDIRGVQQESLRQHLALVPQDGYLFEGSVADNIRLGHPHATREDAERSCADLGILEQLSQALPEGLDTAIESGGASLSSGQRQLVTLARALVADPTVLILDEATAHLDPGSDELVENALARLLHGRTAIVIAHRVSTALRADRVLLLAQGEVVESGPPEELLQRGAAFSRWVHEQAAETTVDEAAPTSANGPLA